MFNNTCFIDLSKLLEISYKKLEKNIRYVYSMYSFLYSMNKSIYGNFYNRLIYYSCNILGIWFYMLARENGCYDKSSMYHCGIHVISNIGNIILYLGLSKQ